MDGRTTQLIGESPAWLSALEQASRLAPLDRPVLVIGERGTGKELVGERLHFLSKRWEGPFVKVNCAALSETLLDSELFGHERGAFTGATEMRRGRFELADGGTIFLDEIATASQQVQEKLLRVVEYGEFQRVGGSKVLTANVRIAAATNADLPSMAEAGKFRWDLLDRLSFDVITLPPLRARRGDKTLLAEFFARRMAIEMAQDFPGFSLSALEAIEAYHWPGNVRELRNFAERLAHRALITAPYEQVRFEPAALDPFASPWRPAPQPVAAEAKPAAPIIAAPAAAAPAPALTAERPAEPAQSFEAAVRLYEMQLIDDALARAGGHQGRAAEILGLTYHQFRGLLKKHGYARRASETAA
ncbi:phage shock protein operon transcriptional activator [Hyphomonas sp.]|uniref:phage shock protein operon transcriptional activator n=1 Tax=Hyphomonas sp. TaxID=87 RepID=UPI003918B62D